MDNTLNAHFNDLQGGIGFFLGWGRGPENGEEEWDDEKTATIKHLTKSGMRKFYHCGFQWSFLRPTVLLTLLEGENTVKLPEDFGSADGRLYASTSSASYLPISFGHIGDVYQKENVFPDTTGFPALACDEPLRVKKRGQTHQIRLWPIADQDYTLKFTYNLNPAYLTGEYPYAYGGAQHAETLLAACRAAAEIELNNVQDGPQFREFSRLMQASMQMDGRNKPQHLGYNRDLSDKMGADWRGRQWETITFDGLTPSTGGL